MLYEENLLFHENLEGHTLPLGMTLKCEGKGDGISPTWLLFNVLR